MILAVGFRYNSPSMKRGFTLVEMLVVVVVIAVLMGMVVRFGNISSSSRRRARTIERLQRLENALSGYYAAFGTYPPVRLHGSRNIYLEVSAHGIQNTDGNENTSLWGWLDGNGNVSNKDAERKAWQQVKAACMAQPVACYYPYSERYNEYVQAYSEAMKSYVSGLSVPDDISAGRQSVFMAGFDTGVPLGRFGSYRDEVDWQKIQLFKFGVLSFLLPRYLFMMEGPRELFTDYAQWRGNNQLPHDPLRGQLYSGGWERLREDVRGDLARVANIPSQAVCARWIANFEKSLVCARPLTLFGIDVMDSDTSGRSGGAVSGGSGATVRPNLEIEVFSPGGYAQDSAAGQYVLNSTTMWDGWDNEFYYYSPPPYQSYVVWSGGPNGRTFPPWVARDTLPADANRCVGYWIADDIVGLKK